MIQAIIFDLDGTLVQTEVLKALSYARAAVELRPNEIAEADVMRAYEDLVGLERREAATTLLERFGLAPAAAARMAELGVDTPWEAFLALRLRRYETMLTDQALLVAQQCPEAIALLRRVRRDGYRTGVATMSHVAHARTVLDALTLRPDLDVIVTRDEVERPKPDPEIYALAATRLGVIPRDCLVIEDSAAGVQAALAAGMPCVAVTTQMTRRGVRESGLLDERWIVDDPRLLEDAVARLLADGGGR